jgi:hypothetical protein
VIAVGILMMPLTLLVVSVILRQRRSPASSVTWLLSILLLPLIAIPLFCFWQPKDPRHRAS